MAIKNNEEKRNWDDFTHWGLNICNIFQSKTCMKSFRSLCFVLYSHGILKMFLYKLRNWLGHRYFVQLGIDLKTKSTIKSIVFDINLELTWKPSRKTTCTWLKIKVWKKSALTVFLFASVWSFNLWGQTWTCCRKVKLNLKLSQVKLAILS